MIFEVFQKLEIWDLGHFEKMARLGYMKWGKSSKFSAFL